MSILIQRVAICITPIIFFSCLFDTKDCEPLLREEIRLNDSTHLIVKTFPNGIIDSVRLINWRKMHGLAKVYNCEDSILYYSNYKNGIRHGVQTSFYHPSGQVRYKGKMEDGNRVEEWRYYHRNGNYAAYEYYSPKGTLNYIRKYDNKGKLKYSDGEGLLYTTILEDDTFYVNTKVDYYVYMAHPPNTEVIVRTGEYIRTDEGVLSSRYSLNGTVLFADLKFSNTGERKFFVDWIIKDTVSGKIEKDTEFFDVYVKEKP